jgi:hypothetical protein
MDLRIHEGKAHEGRRGESRAIAARGKTLEGTKPRRATRLSFGLTAGGRNADPRREKTPEGGDAPGAQLARADDGLLRQLGTNAGRPIGPRRTSVWREKVGWSYEAAFAFRRGGAARAALWRRESVSAGAVRRTIPVRCQRRFGVAVARTTPFWRIRNDEASAEALRVVKAVCGKVGASAATRTRTVGRRLVGTPFRRRLEAGDARR